MLARMSLTDLVLKLAVDEADKAGLRPALEAAIGAAALDAARPVL